MIVFRVPVCSTLLISEDQLDPIDRATDDDHRMQSDPATSDPATQDGHAQADANNEDQ